MQKQNKISSEKSFGFLFTIVFSLISFWPMFYGGNIRIWALVISAIFLMISLTRPVVLKPLNRSWVSFGILLGNVISPLVMVVIFFLIITPIGLFMKIIGKDLLNKRFNKNRSYWINKDKNAGSMRKQF